MEDFYKGFEIKKGSKIKETERLTDFSNYFEFIKAEIRLRNLNSKKIIPNNGSKNIHINFRNDA